MIKSEECMSLILKRIPNFMNDWKDHLEWWGDDVAGFYNDMSAFSSYAQKLLITNDCKQEIKDIFVLIEQLMVEGDKSVSEAAATCFLENLINWASGDSIKATDFVHLLGEESIKYCKAWDVFTGVKTEGLWSDDEDFEVK